MAPLLLMTLLLLQPRESALEGEWVVEIVDNIKVMPESRVTITFSGTRVLGLASCNSYTGTYRVADDSMKFESLLTTMKACDQSRMSQERDFLGVLRAVSQYEIASGGVLTLRTAAGKAITARRAPK